MAEDLTPEPERAGMDDDAMRALVKRLSRPHPSGGSVIERAAIMASGGEATAILEWITEHGGEAEAVAPAPASGGLWGGRDTRATAAPRRFVLPPGALG